MKLQDAIAIRDDFNDAIAQAIDNNSDEVALDVAAEARLDAAFFDIDSAIAAAEIDDGK